MEWMHRAGLGFHDQEYPSSLLSVRLVILATGGNGIGEDVQGCGAVPPATRMIMA